MKRLKALKFAYIALALVCGPSIASAQFATNLIFNPDAELGTAGFAVTENFTTALYGAPGGFPTQTDPGSPTRALRFFSGGEGSDQATGSQSIDLTFATSAIATGQSAFHLSGYFGGYATQDDFALLTVTFFDNLNQSVGAPVSTGGVDVYSRAGMTGLLFRSTDGFVPMNASSAEITLLMQRSFGTYDDGYADDLSFSIDDAAASTVTPEPASLSLLATGLFGAFAVCRRRRNN